MWAAKWPPWPPSGAVWRRMACMWRTRGAKRSGRALVAASRVLQTCIRASTFARSTLQPVILWNEFQPLRCCLNWPQMALSMAHLRWQSGGAIAPRVSRLAHLRCVRINSSSSNGGSTEPSFTAPVVGRRQLLGTGAGLFLAQAAQPAWAAGAGDAASTGPKMLADLPMIRCTQLSCKHGRLKLQNKRAAAARRNNTSV